MSTSTHVMNAQARKFRIKPVYVTHRLSMRVKLTHFTTGFACERPINDRSAAVIILAPLRKKCFRRFCRRIEWTFSHYTSLYYYYCVLFRVQTSERRISTGDSPFNYFVCMHYVVFHARTQYERNARQCRQLSLGCSITAACLVS